jgi:glycosyltransferase A (GT-A) superfamily protein (DUF2064 family)
MAEDMLDMLRWSGAEVVVSYAPEWPLEEYTAWLGTERVYWAQSGRDAGARMANALRRALTIKKFDKALLVLPDAPALDDEAVRRGLEELDWKTCALGPSLDGGYYLVGFDREGFLPDLFTRAEPGGTDVLARARNVLDIYRRRVALLGELPRITDLEGLRRLAADPPRHLARSRALARFRALNSPGS